MDLSRVKQAPWSKGSVYVGLSPTNCGYASAFSAGLEVYVDDIPNFGTDRVNSDAYGVTFARNLRAIPEVLKEFGIDLEITLMNAGLSPDTFSDPGNIITISELGALVTECVRATHCGEFGLRVGMKHDATNAGLAGIAAVNAETVADALCVMSDYLKLSQTGFAIRVQQSAGSAIASAVLLNPDMESGNQVAEGATASLVRFMREILEPGWDPEQVLLVRSRPSNTRVFDNFFRAPIQFNSTECGIVLGSNTLQKSLLNRNEKYFEVLISELKSSDSRALDAFVTELKLIMHRQLSDGLLTLERTAAAFNCGARTFARRLADKGLLFSTLAEEVKYEKARSLLRGDAKISEITAMLGYSEAGTFTRSFKRWSGETPKAWRKSCGAPRPQESVTSATKSHGEQVPNESSGSAPIVRSTARR
jgi:AraC-like DNA-binding protein